MKLKKIHPVKRQVVDYGLFEDEGWQFHEELEELMSFWLDAKNGEFYYIANYLNANPKKYPLLIERLLSLGYKLEEEIIMLYVW